MKSITVEKLLGNNKNYQQVTGKISFCLSSVISAIKAISLSPKTIILLKSLCLKNPANSKPGRLISPVKITLFKDSSFPVTCL